MARQARAGNMNLRELLSYRIDIKRAIWHLSLRNLCIRRQEILAWRGDTSPGREMIFTTDRINTGERKWRQSHKIVRGNMNIVALKCIYSIHLRCALLIVICMAIFSTDASCECRPHLSVEGEDVWHENRI